MVGRGCKGFENKVRYEKSPKTGKRVNRKIDVSTHRRSRTKGGGGPKDLEGLCVSDSNRTVTSYNQAHSEDLIRGRKEGPKLELGEKEVEKLMKLARSEPLSRREMRHLACGRAEHCANAPS